MRNFECKEIIYFLLEIQIVLVSIVVLTNTSYPQVNPLWQVTFNDSIAETNYADKSKLDNEGNIVSLAHGTSDISSGVDYVVVKYNSKGVKLWNRRFNGTGNGSDYPTDIIIDRFNNIYITGRSRGENSGYDFLTLKYSPQGLLLWSKRLNWIINGHDEARSITLDSNCNVYVTGIGAAGLIGGIDTHDMLTVKYDIDGNQIWVRSFAGYNNASDWAYSVVCDQNENIYVSGFTLSSNLNFTDIITIRYDTSGNEQWQRRYFNNGDDLVRPLMTKLDNEGNLIVCSYFRGDTTRIDYLTYKYNPHGNLLWSQMYDADVRNLDWVTDFIIDDQNNVYVTGSSWNNIVGYDYLTIKYSEMGEEMWINRVNDSTINTNDQEPRLGIDSRRNIFIAGTSYHFNGEYGAIIILNNNGIMLSKFRNTSITFTASVNVDAKNNFTVSGNYGTKIITAKYLDVITGLNSKASSVSIPSSFLSQNYPNPFNPKTIIYYQLKNLLSDNKIRLIIYDTMGNQVVTLVNRNQPEGEFSVQFDGTNFSSGIYFYSLYAGGKIIDTKKMLLIK